MPRGVLHNGGLQDCVSVLQCTLLVAPPQPCGWVVRLCPLKRELGFRLLPLPSLEAGGGTATSLLGKREMAVPWVKAGKAISEGSEQLRGRLWHLGFRRCPHSPRTFLRSCGWAAQTWQGWALHLLRAQGSGDIFFFNPFFPGMTGMLHHAFSSSDSAITHCCFVLAKQQVSQCPPLHTPRQHAPQFLFPCISSKAVTRGLVNAALLHQLEGD